MASPQFFRQPFVARLDFRRGLSARSAERQRGAGILRGGIAKLLVTLRLLRLRRRLRDIRPLASPDRQDSAVDEALIRARDGIRVDPQSAGKISDRGDGVSRGERSDGDHAPDAFLDLLPDGGGTGWIDVEHCTINLVQ